MQHFSDEQILAQIEAALAEEPEEKIISFLCNWCSYAGSDLAGVSRLQYPPNNRFIRTMCSGRVAEKLHPARLRAGRSDGAGLRLPHRRLPLHQCQPLDQAPRRAAVGPHGEAGHPAGASATGMDQRRRGPRFAQIMRELEEMRQKVTPEEIEHTKKVLKAQRLSKEKTEQEKIAEPYV